jgi:hypothetical protein
MTMPKNRPVATDKATIDVDQLANNAGGTENTRANICASAATSKGGA